MFVFANLLFSLIFCCWAVIESEAAMQGWDTANAVSVSQMQSAFANGCTMFIGRYYNGNSGTDNTGIQNIVNARKGGYVDGRYPVDSYHVPLYSAYSATGGSYYIINGIITKTSNWYTQARRPIDSLNSAVSRNGLQYGIGRTFLVVSSTAGSAWSTSTFDNCNFIKTFASYFPGLGSQCGIFSKKTEFEAIAGTNCNVVDSNGNQCALWWFDSSTGSQDGTGFQSFSGWTTPYSHQYGTAVSNVCQSGVVGNQDYLL